MGGGRDEEREEWDKVTGAHFHGTGEEGGGEEDEGRREEGSKTTEGPGGLGRGQSFGGSYLYIMSDGRPSELIWQGRRDRRANMTTG